MTPLRWNVVPYNESLCASHTYLCATHTCLCVSHTCLCVSHTCLCATHTCVTHASRRASQRGGGGGGGALHKPGTSLVRSSDRSSSASGAGGAGGAGDQHEEAPSTPGSQQSSIAIVISGFVLDEVCPHTCSHILAYYAASLRGILKGHL